nr:F0F1 ATP synthase subunit B [bacterium]
MELNPVDILIHIINIVVLYLLLRMLVYKPVKKFMDARTQRIERQLQDAADAKAQADTLRQSYDARMAQADQEAQARLREGSQRAGEAAQAILDDANAKAADIIQSAKQRAQQEKQAAIAELQPQIASMAVSIAGQILQREVKEEDNRQLIDTFFEKAGQEAS